MVGGLQKGHPNAQDPDGAVQFYRDLLHRIPALKKAEKLLFWYNGFFILQKDF